MSYRNELVQVAAVAVAMLEDELYGYTDSGSGLGWTADILENVHAERAAQDEKWGPQHHTRMEWLAILGEEVGEACRAALETHQWPPRQQQVFTPQGDTDGS